MSAILILAGSWSPYEEYKLCKGQNPDIFLPSDRYEIDFLVKRIAVHYPQYTDIAIELSINYVKRTLYGGCKRSLFVELVMSNLLIRKPLVVY
jgi:hypothetical protein